MMCGLVDVHGPRDRIPSRHQQSGPRMTDSPVGQYIPEGLPKRVRVVLVPVKPADAPQLPGQEGAKASPILAEDLRSPVLVEAEYFQSRMPQRKRDADDSSRRGSGNQIEIRSDRTVEVLFELRQESRWKRAENAAPVDAQEAALPLPRSFGFPYQRLLSMFAPVRTTLGTPSPCRTTLMVSMIREGLLAVREADSIKHEWATRHRFVLKLDSFQSLLP